MRIKQMRWENTARYGYQIPLLYCGVQYCIVHKGPSQIGHDDRESLADWRLHVRTVMGSPDDSSRDAGEGQWPVAGGWWREHFACFQEGSQDLTSVALALAMAFWLLAVCLTEVLPDKSTVHHVTIDE